MTLKLADGARPPAEATLAVYVGRSRYVDATWRVAGHRFSGDGFALATYEEWHDLPGAGNGRLSSVLFGEDDEAPNGVVWLHLHEVWIERETGNDEPLPSTGG